MADALNGAARIREKPGLSTATGWHRRLILVVGTLTVVLASCPSHGRESSVAANDDKLQIQKEYYRLLNAARNGDADSKVELFRYFAEHHSSLAPHVRTVIDNLTEAAALQDPDALFLLGQIFDDAIFVAEDEDKALRLFLVAAQMGHWEAMSRLIVLFAESARGVEDIEKRQNLVINAKHWNQKLQQHPDAPQKWKLEGKFTAGTASVVSNPEDGEGWALLGEAARAGHPEAVDFVRDIYAFALDSGEEDRAEAERMLAHLQPIIDDIGLQRD